MYLRHYNFESILSLDQIFSFVTMTSDYEVHGMLYVVENIENLKTGILLLRELKMEN